EEGRPDPGIQDCEDGRFDAEALIERLLGVANLVERECTLVGKQTLARGMKDDDLANPCALDLCRPRDEGAHVQAAYGAPGKPSELQVHVPRFVWDRNRLAVNVLQIE